MFNLDSSMWGIYLKPIIIVQYILLIINVRNFLYYYKFVLYFRKRIRLIKTQLKSNNKDSFLIKVFNNNESIYYSIVSYFFPKELNKIIKKVDKDCLIKKDNEMYLLEKYLLFLRSRVVYLNFFSILLFLLFSIIIYVDPHRFIVNIDKIVSFKEIFNLMSVFISFIVVFLINFMISFWIMISSNRSILYLYIEIEKIKKLLSEKDSF